MDAAYAACDAKVQCGQCREEAVDVINEARSQGCCGGTQMLQAAE